MLLRLAAQIVLILKRSLPLLSAEILRLHRLGAAAWLGFPLLLLATTTFALNQAGFLDPYVYAAYIYDYPQTLERFGQTYYSSRIAYIFLDRVFADVFGVELGYFACRLVALGCATGSVYAIAARHYSTGTAVLVAAWVCFIPWLARSLLWTHYDGFGTVYLLMALALVIAPRQHRLLAHVAAGAAYGLATNCNLLLLALGGAFAPSWWVLNHGNGLRWVGKHALAAIAGFLVTYVGLSLAYQAQFPSGGAFLETATLRTARELLGGQAANWFLPLGKFLDYKVYIPLIPLVYFGAVAALLWRHGGSIPGERRNFILASALYLGFVIAVELILHFVFSAATLSQFHYLIYFLPACALVLISLAGEWESAASAEERVRVYAVAAALIAVWLLRPAFPDPVKFTNVWPWLILGVATVAAAATRPIGSAVATVAACAMTFAVYASFQQPEYDIRRSDTQRVAVEWDVFKGALFLQSFIGANVPTDQALGFWYSNMRSRRELNSVQSMYLWGYSRLAPPTGVDLGMPHIDPNIKAAIESKSFVALLGLDAAEVDRGLAALSAANIHYREHKRAAFDGKKWGYSLVLVDILIPSP